MSNQITKLIGGTIAAAVISVSFAACDGTTSRNANTNNGNLRTVASPSPTPTELANTNTDTGRAPTREDYERDRDRYQREARESGRTVGTGVNDGWLWVKTRFDLAAADDLRDSTINVDVDNGVVTLSGTVASAAQKTRAEQVAKSVADVRSVRNQLRVASDNANTDGNANSNTRRPNANR